MRKSKDIPPNCFREEFNGRIYILSPILENENQISFKDEGAAWDWWEKRSGLTEESLERMQRATDGMESVARQPCDFKDGNLGDVDCTETMMCITEYCYPCHARACFAALRKDAEKGASGKSIYDEVRDEVTRSRAKYPQNRHMLAAVTGELGELADALIKSEGHERVREEAVQVAATAVRLVLDGDADFGGGVEPEGGEGGND